MVSSGAGNAFTTINGRLDNIFIKPPSGSPTLDVEIQDADLDTVAARGNITTSALVEIDNICKGLVNVMITNASADGTYIVKLRWYFGV